MNRPMYHGQRACGHYAILSARRGCHHRGLIPLEDLIGGGWGNVGNPHQADSMATSTRPAMRSSRPWLELLAMSLSLTPRCRLDLSLEGLKNVKIYGR
jgi:hypothetical protein